MRKWFVALAVAGGLVLGYQLGGGLVSGDADCVAGAQCRPAGQPCSSSAECCGVCVFTNDEGVGRCEGGH